MRKIDKSKILSTKYKAWEEAFEESNSPHPQYKSSSTRKEHYLDIVMNLLHCQNGICAYTEMFLCDPKHYSADNWKDGKYISVKPGKFGQLDHFDESLKSKEKDNTGRKDWLWDNFFMVHTDVNSSAIKGSKPIDYLLKPDLPNYDPLKFLKYNANTHLFIPNDENLNEEEQDRVQDMINTLGINNDAVVKSRRIYLLMNSMSIKFAHITGYVEPEPNQFITEHTMIRKGQNTQNP